LLQTQAPQIPGGTGTFTDFGPPSFDGVSVAFFGGNFEFPFPRGIYIGSGGPLVVVADKSTPIPGDTGNFTFLSAGAPSLDGGNVAFRGAGSSEKPGIYTNIGGSLIKVIAIGDSFDGKKVRFFFFGGEGLSGNSIAFTAQFRDGSEHIFVAELVLTATIIPGDANADGFVNLADLGVIINAFRGTPAPGNGDCNMDTFTNLADLGCVITNFRG